MAIHEPPRICDKTCQKKCCQLGSNILSPAKGTNNRVNQLAGSRSFGVTKDKITSGLWIKMMIYEHSGSLRGLSSHHEVRVT